MLGMHGSRIARRSLTGVLAVVLAVSVWSPLLAVSSPRPSPVAPRTAAPSCACPDCSEEKRCCCEHGHAPRGSTCSAPTPEPSSQAVETAGPTLEGRALVAAPELLLPAPGARVDAPYSISQRSYPYPAPPDKVPISIG